MHLVVEVKWQRTYQLFAFRRVFLISLRTSEAHAHAHGMSPGFCRMTRVRMELTHTPLSPILSEFLEYCNVVVWA